LEMPILSLIAWKKEQGHTGPEEELGRKGIERQKTSFEPEKGEKIGSLVFGECSAHKKEEEKSVVELLYKTSL